MLKIDVPGSEENLKKLKQTFPDYLIVPCSAESELALKEAAKHNLIDYIPGESEFKIKAELNEKQKNALEFIKNSILLKHKSTGVQEIMNKSVFSLLNYISVFCVENEGYRNHGILWDSKVEGTLPI